MKSLYIIPFFVYLFMGISINTSSQNTDRYDLTEISKDNSLAATKDSLNIKMVGNRLTVENLPKDDVIEIYNIMGSKVFNRRVKAGTNEYDISLPRGYYIIKIGKFTRKIVIR